MNKAWQLEIQWKDGLEQWIPLKDLKEPNPIEVAEYALKMGLLTLTYCLPCKITNYLSQAS